MENFRGAVGFEDDVGGSFRRHVSMVLEETVGGGFECGHPFQSHDLARPLDGRIARGESRGGEDKQKAQEKSRDVSENQASDCQAFALNGIARALDPVECDVAGDDGRDACERTGEESDDAADQAGQGQL